MASKYNRDNFYNSNIIDNTLEKDLIRNHWNLFKIQRPMSFFTVTRSYIARPDLLSLKLYRVMDYWWILAKYNEIDDWWNDIHVEDVLNVPDVQDIEEFYSKVKSAQRRSS